MRQRGKRLPAKPTESAALRTLSELIARKALESLKEKRTADGGYSEPGLPDPDVLPFIKEPLQWDEDRKRCGARDLLG